MKRCPSPLSTYPQIPIVVMWPPRRRYPFGRGGLLVDMAGCASWLKTVARSSLESSHQRGFPFLLAQSPSISYHFLLSAHVRNEIMIKQGVVARALPRRLSPRGFSQTWFQLRVQPPHHSYLHAYCHALTAAMQRALTCLFAGEEVAQG